MAIDASYMRKLRVAMNPHNSRKLREEAKARIRKDIKPMLEVAKLEIETGDICSARLRPKDRFIMRKRIAEIVEHEMAVKADNSTPEMCESATIGGTYGMCG